MKEKYKQLFEPITLPCGITLENRIVMAPMTNWSGHKNGNVSEEEIAYYSRRIEGLGAVITACTHVTENGQGFSGEFASYSDEFIPSLKQLADAIHAKGTKAILQIFHAGRMTRPELIGNTQPVSASAVAIERPGRVVPREMAEEEIIHTIKAFGEATRRAIEAGYDGVEIHGANHYLFQQFFSPHSNRRTDKWGGTVEKRMTFSLEVIEEVHKIVKQYAKKPFIVGYRLSPEEPENPGITLEDTLLFVDKLATMGLDYLHISLEDFFGGSIRTNSKTSILKQINDRVGDKILLIGVGLLHTPDDVIKALNSGIPIIALGRELIIEPDWIKKVKTGEEETIRTTLTKNDQHELVIPNPLWKKIMIAKGWFPVVE